MKKLVLIAVFLLGFSVIVMAEDTPKIEVFGGFSYVRVDTSTALKGTKYDWLDLNMKGFDGSLTINANKWAGVVIDVGANYGVVATNPSNPRTGAWMDYRILSYMGGPKFTLSRGKVSPFAQALFGYAGLKRSESHVDTKERTFAMAFGGGVDVNLNSRFAVRAVQLDSLLVRSQLRGNFAKNLRLSTGIVLKLGKK